MPITARSYSMPELLFELQSTLRREARTFCPVTDWVREHPKATEGEFEDWVTSHPEYAVPTCVDIIRFTGHYNSAEATAQLQRLYASHLVRQPWDIARHGIEQLVGRIHCQGGLDAQAVAILVAAIAEHHPSPKGFLAQDHVRRRLPKSIDLTHMRCAGHPHLAGVHLQGEA